MPTNLEDMRNLLSALTGKAVRQVARLRGGGGSALPGLVVEKLDRGFMARVLAQLPLGVAVVSGTNGKTTTTKMIVEMLEALGLKVFTNRTGSNFSRGVVAAMVQECSITGKLDADIAVLELDEAHAMYFIDRVPPNYTLLLNVLRDQLDRFGEIDTTAKLLQRIADATRDVLIVNHEDALVSQIGERTRERAAAAGPRVVEFGLSEQLREQFPGEDDVHARTAAAERAAGARGETSPAIDVRLVEVGDAKAHFAIDQTVYEAQLRIEGLYNTFNAAAALATVRAIIEQAITTDEPAIIKMAGATNESLIEALSTVRPAFGRGETLELDGNRLELVLVKNPAGFNLALASYAASDAQTMIAINDQYADGRDVSWLWDVDFRVLQPTGVSVVSGVRAADMALRLEHDGVMFTQVNTDLRAALEELRTAARGQHKRIFCTYTAMLELRKHLAELTEVEEIW